MKVAILREPLVEIEVGKKEDLDTVLERIAALPEVVAIAEKVGSDSYYRRYYQENRVASNHELRPIADAILKGIDIDGYGEDAYDYYVHNAKRDLEGAMTDIVDALTEIERFQYADDEIREGLAEKLRETCIETMEEKDTSTLADNYGDWDKVELSFAIDMRKLGFDDLQVEHNRDHQFDAWTANPNANLMRMFKMFNIHPTAFIDAVIEKYGQDPRVPFVDERHKDQDWRVRDAEKIAAKWRRFCNIAELGASGVGPVDGLDQYEQREIAEIVAVAKTVHDIDRPAAFDMRTLLLIMEEASYGGTPVFTARYPIKDVINGKLDQPFLATGGFIGIHNFSNGSGYVENAMSEVLINPSVGGFTTLSINDTYGIVESYFDCTTKPAPSVNWVHVATETWRSERSAEGSYAVINAMARGDGTAYWVETFEKTGAAGGLYMDMEGFDSLQEAMDAGSRAISLTVDELAAEQSNGMKM